MIKFFFMDFDSLKAQTDVIFFPVRLDEDYRFVLPRFMTEVSVPVEGDVSLSGLYYRRYRDAPLIIYFQGNAGNLQNFLDNHRMVLDWGYNVLVVDYRSFGKSGGELLGEKQLYADAEQVYAFARALDYGDEEIILYGYSMGVAMACHLAGCKPAKAVIMESGYSSVDEMDFARGLCPAYALNNAEKAKDILIPTLVIHGELDIVIPPDHAERMWENLASDKKEIHILTGGGHGDLKSRPEYAGIINEFIDSLPGN